jgi:hypothetical protein
MSADFHNTVKALTPLLRAGDLDACERAVISAMQSLPSSPFHIAIDIGISNEPFKAAQHFDRFFQSEAQRIKIVSAYAEMNGFYINPKSWFFDLFAYTTYGGHDGDYDWLADWQSGTFPSYPIHGMEALQAVYASDAWGNKSCGASADMSSLLVVIKFQQFVKKTAPYIQQLAFPLLVTAHDFDFIAELGSGAAKFR